MGPFSGAEGGPSWDDDGFLSEDYGKSMASEHVRALLMCRLEDRLIALRSGDETTMLAEIHRMIVEAASDGRIDDVHMLSALAAEILP